MVEDEGEWKDITRIGYALKKLDPAFDTRTYGFVKLSKMIKAYSDVLEMKWTDNKTHILVRKKEGQEK